MIDPETKSYIDQKFTSVSSFPTKKTGDTPTDALQLVNKKYVDTRSYIGFVNASGGIGIPFPIGWTSVRNSTGNYTVTHNLGIFTYGVVACLNANSPTDDRGVTINISGPVGANSFTVVTGFLNSGTPTSTNSDFYFILHV